MSEIGTTKNKYKNSKDGSPNNILSIYWDLHVVNLAIQKYTMSMKLWNTCTTTITPQSRDMLHWDKYDSQQRINLKNQWHSFIPGDNLAIPRIYNFSTGITNHYHTIDSLMIMIHSKLL